MARQSRFPKSPCGCDVIKDSFRLIVDGPEPEAWRGVRGGLSELLGLLPSQSETPAYDRKLRLWFLHDEYAFPDEERDDLICLECDQITKGVVVLPDFTSDIDTYRQEAGLDPEWHFGWIN
jgi:hypothetical protein